MDLSPRWPRPWQVYEIEVLDSNVFGEIWLAQLLERAGAGDAWAQARVGNAYWLGERARKDIDQALFWWRKAAEQGVAEAQSALGSAYRNGRGVKKDEGEAYFWLDVATTGDFSESPDLKKATVQEREDAAKSLSQHQLQEEQVRARKWIEEHPPRAKR